jgi:hypothetical protein
MNTDAEINARIAALQKQRNDALDENAVLRGLLAVKMQEEAEREKAKTDQPKSKDK